MNDVDINFLGTGWSFPPSFSRGDASVDMVSDDEDIRQSLTIILSTTVGARIMLPTFGCNLWQKVFKTLTTTFKTQLRDAVTQAITNWEPRINVDNVSVTAQNQEQGIVDIVIDYTIRQTNTRSNLVYPFYLGEATLAPEQI